LKRRGLWLVALLGAGVALAALAFDGKALKWEAWRARLTAPSPSRFPVRGIDVSHHQGVIDWPRVKGSGQSFAFIKATEGTDFRDERFQDNWRAARASGLVTGAYHFFTFCSPGLLQADHFLAVTLELGEEGLGGQVLPPAVDIEFTGNCLSWESLTAIRRELGIFVERLESRTGLQPILYTTLDCLEDLIPPSLYAHPYWLRSLWGEPRVEASWKFWQHSALGDVPGVEGPVDLNVFAQSQADWQRLVLGSVEQAEGWLEAPGSGREAQRFVSRESSQAEASSLELNRAP
jgi:lysozyme